MSNEKNKPEAARPERRVFFGQLLATVGGGWLTGRLLEKLLQLEKEGSNRNRPVSISAHPMAVPRTKEGSKSNAE